LRVQEEAKAKDVKAKTQIERLTKQCEEYKQRNKELQDELKHLSEQMIASSNKSAAQQRNSNNPNNVSGSSASQAA
jgi:prefoldin subunit 5